MLKYAIIYTTRSENCVKFYGKVLTKFNGYGVLHSKQAEVTLPFCHTKNQISAVMPMTAVL